jgi:hypothetical protein
MYFSYNSENCLQIRKFWRKYSGQLVTGDILQNNFFKDEIFLNKREINSNSKSKSKFR